MKLIDLQDINEGDMYPPAIIGMHRVHALNPCVDEQSHVFRLCIPLMHWGEVWDYACNGRRWGFKWLHIVFRFTDIVDREHHIWRFEPRAWVGLMG